MPKFKKGNKIGFKLGHLPYNKTRKTVKTAKSDSNQTIYKRLTRKITSLVKNVPYKDDQSQSVDDTRPAVLLRPKDVDCKTEKSLKKNQR